MRRRGKSPSTWTYGLIPTPHICSRFHQFMTVPALEIQGSESKISIASTEYQPRFQNLRGFVTSQLGGRSGKPRGESKGWSKGWTIRPATAILQSAISKAYPNRRGIKQRNNRPIRRQSSLLTMKDARGKTCLLPKTWQSSGLSVTELGKACCRSRNNHLLGSNKRIDGIAMICK